MSADGTNSTPPTPSPEEVAQAMWSQDHASQAAGMHLVEVGAGTAVISLEVRAAHVNGLGVCHGGYLFMLADSAMAFASNSANLVALAAAAQIDFIRPARLGDTLVATATTRSEGRRTSITDVEVRRRGAEEHGDEGNHGGTAGELVAMMRGRTTRTGANVVAQAPDASNPSR